VTLIEHGADQVLLVLQGELGASDTIEGAGLAATVKAEKP